MTLVQRLPEVSQVHQNLSWPCKDLRNTNTTRRTDDDRPAHEVGDVAAEGLERGVGLGRPHPRHPADEHAAEDLLQLLRHDDQALDGLLEVDEGRPDDAEQTVVADQLLSQDGVHRVRVEHGVLLYDLRARSHSSVKANVWEISSDTHQLQFIKLHHLKLEIFKSI